MSIVILAIESSCDDTAAAVIVDGQVRSNILADQKIHAQYGGVVPELASRAHQANIVPVVDAALKQSGVSPDQLSAIAFTKGPGLMGSLMVGVSFAKGLALSYGIPLIEVHHLHAHVLAHFAEDPTPDFPFLCLLVSGGHTQILLVRDHLELEVLGSTTDDAAGEAFDKAGKMMGLGYPAGPLIDQHAKSGKPVFDFPHPQLPNYQFSFSGIKTSIRYFLQAQVERDPAFIQKNLPDLCASIQYHIIEILLDKLVLAARDTGIRTVAIAGGVSANSQLRQRLKEVGLAKGWKTFVPPMDYSTDNAAMIGVTGYFKYKKGQFAPLTVKPEARIPLNG
ncbi:MAG: tRNA (adenosine(37)-N6)-threonylcarbamoyltransferase complex transferase subunit TsaD [Saprospiraceae bacterium]|nr:tRNA (adenosine(37)-N6)-threonylcarbamoyltransferase complex transferase subunit TsaD [Saprospiraceae bacterium]